MCFGIVWTVPRLLGGRARPRFAYRLLNPSTLLNALYAANLCPESRRTLAHGHGWGHEGPCRRRKSSVTEHPGNNPADIPAPS